VPGASIVQAAPASARRRLVAAMTEVVAEHGYQGATVGRVVAGAGVSRATFYELFRSREECFLLAYRHTLKATTRLIVGAATAVEIDERPAAVVDAVLRAALAHPDDARLVLVEALAAPRQIRRGHDEQIFGLEQSIANFLAEQSEGARSLRIPPPALIAGIGGVIAERLRSSDEQALPGLGVHLIAWLDSYRLDLGEEWEGPSMGELRELVLWRPSTTVGQAEAESLLPRGRSALPKPSVEAARRLRVIRATARLMVERGYRRTTVGDIVSAARIPRAAFYALFKGKAEAFAEAQNYGMQGAIAATASQFALPNPWPERVWRAAEQLLAYLAAHPDLAWLDFVESYAAGPDAVHRRHQNQMAFSIFLEEGYRQNNRAASLPRLCSEAVGMALYGMMRRCVLEGRASEMLSLLPESVYVVLAPFIGPAAALRFVAAKVQTAY
jgi:AcrR family transcriptional regulator